METRIKKIDVFEDKKVKVGEKEITLYIADDGSEFGTEQATIRHNELLQKVQKTKEATDRMHMREVKLMDETYYLIKTTTLEDLHMFENNQSGYCHNLDKKYFKSGIWVIARRCDGGDYRDTFDYENIEALKKDFDFIMSVLTE